MAENDPEDLIRDAWRVIGELMHQGRATLTDSETPLEPTQGELVRLAQWLASLKPPKKRTVPKPEDFLPQRTYGQEKAS